MIAMVEPASNFDCYGATRSATTASRFGWEYSCEGRKTKMVRPLGWTPESTNLVVSISGVVRENARLTEWTLVLLW